MRILELPIQNRARRFGYVFWLSTMDETTKSFFAGATSVLLWYNQNCIGVKAIDYEHRRISIGYKYTRTIELSCNYYVLSMNDDNNVYITTR